MSAQQQTNVQTLSNDLNAIKSGSQVTPEQKQALSESLIAMADGATKPSQASVDALSADLSEAMTDGNLSNKEKMQLSNDLAEVMNSANIPKSEVDAAIADAQAVLTASGVDKADVQEIAGDLQAIAKEGQANATATKTNTTAAANSSSRPVGRRFMR
jgi:hypothetical protein